MARQINKKALFGLLGVLLVVVVVAVWMLLRLSDTSRQFRDAQQRREAARAAGDIKTELFELQTMLNLEPDNVRLREEYARRLEDAGQAFAALREWMTIVTQDPNNVTGRLRLARDAAGRQDWGSVGRHTMEVIQRDRENLEAHLLLTKSYLGRTMLPEAEAEIAETLRLQGDNIDALMTRARILHARGEVAQAAEAVDKMATDYPENVEVQMFRGDFYVGRQNPEKAKEAYTAAVEVTDSKVMPLLRLAGLAEMSDNATEAEERYRQALQECKTDSERMTVYGNLARFLGNHERPEEALKLYEEALVLAPRHPLLLSDRAAILLEMNRLDESENDIRQLLSRQTRDRIYVQGLYLQGRLLMARGDFTKAAQSLEEVVRENTNLVEPLPMTRVLLSLAQCYELLNDYAKTQEILQQGLTREPKNWAYRFSLARLLWGHKEADKVVQLLSGQSLPVEGVVLYARALESTGNIDSARAALIRAHEQAPENVGLLLELARLESALRNHAQALVYAEQVLKADPNMVNAWLLKAGTLATQQKLEQAETTYQEAMTRFPKQHNVALQYASFLLRQDRFQKGEELLKKVMQESGSSVETDAYLAGYYLRAGKVDEGRAEYRRLAEKYPDSLPLKSQLVMLAIDARDYAEAEKYLELLRQQSPDDLTVDVLRARMLVAQENWVEVEKVIAPVVAKRPNDPGTLYYLALAQMGQGDLKDARTNLERAVENSPAFQRGWEMLTTVYLRMGRPDLTQTTLEAISRLRKATPGEEDDSDLARIGSYVDMTHGKPAAAESKLRALLAENPQDRTIKLALAEALFAQDKREEAGKVLREAWEMSKGDVRATIGLVRLYLLDNRVDDARQLLIEANEAAGGREPSFLAVLANIYQNQGLSEKAQEMHDQIARMDPDNPLPILDRANRLRQEGKPDQARMELESALQRVPDSVELRVRLALLLAESGEVEKSLKILDDGLKSNAWDLTLIQTLGTILFQTGRGPEAEKILNEALAHYAQSDQAQATLHLMLARLYANRGGRSDLDPAVREFRAVKRLQPGNMPARLDLVRMYLRMNLVMEARAECLEIISWRPVLDAYLALGDMSLRERNPREAIGYLDEAIRQFPKAWQPWKGRAVAQAAQESLGEMEKDARKAIELSSNNLDVIREMMALLMSKQLHDRALRLCDDLAAKLNRPGLVPYLKGNVEMDRKQYVKARTYYETALTDAPDRDNMRLAIAETYLGEGNYTKAIELARSVPLTNSIIRTPVYSVIVRAYEGLADKTSQERVYREWIEVEPGNPQPSNNLAYMLAEDNRAQEALDILTAMRQRADSRALQRFDIEPQVLDTEAWAYYKKGDHQRAEQILAAVVEKYPGALSAVRHRRTVLGELLTQAESQGDVSTARTYRIRLQEMDRRDLELGQDDPVKQYELAKVYLNENKPVEGINALEQSLRLRDDPKVRRTLVEALLSVGRVEDAGRELTALKRVPGDDADTLLLEVRYNLARAETRDRAKSLLRTVLQKYPDSPLAHYLQARMHVEDRQLDEAEQELDQTIRLQPNFLEAMILRVRVLQERKKFDQALQACDEILKVSPNNAEVLVARGNVLGAQGNVAEAESWFRSLIQRYPQSPTAHERLAFVLSQRGMIDQAIQEYRTARQLLPRSTDLLRDLCDLYVRAGREDQAVVDVQEFLTSNRSSVLGYCLLGKLYERTERTGQAEDAYRSAINNNPQDPSGYMALVNLYLNQRQYKLAQVQLDRMIELDVLKAHAWQLKGDCLDLEGDAAGAEQAYRTSLRLDPQNVDAGNNLAWMLLTRKSPPQIDEAIRLAQEAVDNRPNFYPGMDTLGWAYYLKGDYRRAVLELEKATRLMEGSQSLSNWMYYHLGLALVKDGQVERGKVALRKVLQNEPTFPEAEQIRGILQKTE